jgi:prepilin signal peptidase PulO-like enzyme (type II secretory pathway)
MFLTYTALISIIFIIGAIIGSFLSAWIWRVHNGRSMLEKHSVCPHCQHALGPLDLIPVASWVVLKGTCRYCHTKISAQYVLLEVGTGLLFVAAAFLLSSLFPSAYFLFQLWPLVSLLFSWLIIALLVALFVYDLHWGYLPDIWTLGGSAVALVATIITAFFNQPLLWQPGAHYGEGVRNALYVIRDTTLSGLLAALFFLAIVWGSEKILHKPGMGLGDVKLALLMGLFLGFPGIVIAIYLAFILGAVLSLLLLAAKQKSFGQAIPFGPFLVIGTLIAWWITPLVVNWYQQFL